MTEAGDIDDMDCIELVERVTEYLDAALADRCKAMSFDRVNEFENVPGVDQINTPAKSVKTLLNVTKWIRWAFFILAGVLLASS